jgi:hypothetical protein
MSSGLTQEMEDGLDFGDDEGEELTNEEAEEGARAFDAAQVHQQTAPATPHQPNRTHQMT